jgi:hypothetical protein
VCFSVQADLVAGAVLLPVGALSLREVRCRREVAFAALPLLFAAHQLVEAAVWAAEDGDVSAGVGIVATLVYLLFALPVLPTLLPLAVLMLEPRAMRMRVAPFVGLGLVVSAVMLRAVLDGPIEVTEHAHALRYGVGVPDGVLWSALYVVAVIGPSLLSGYPSIIAFGALNLVGLVVVALLAAEAFVSIWCVYAAVASVSILAHMLSRRDLPDPHRMQGEMLVH